MRVRRPAAFAASNAFLTCGRGRKARRHAGRRALPHHVAAERSATSSGAASGSRRSTDWRREWSTQCSYGVEGRARRDRRAHRRHGSARCRSDQDRSRHRAVGPVGAAGEAITRGLQIAIDEINAEGRRARRPQARARAARRRGDPGQGRDRRARADLQARRSRCCSAGSTRRWRSPSCRSRTRSKVPFMGPWAAGTPITRNGAKPNYVFRVSAVDEIVDKAMLQYAQKTYGAKKPGMILVNNPWGESNEKGLLAALAREAGIKLGRRREVRGQRRRRRAAAVAPQGGGRRRAVPGRQRRPGAQVVKSLDRMGWKRAGRSRTGACRAAASPSSPARARRDVMFVQTYSFFGKQIAGRARRCSRRSMAKYPDIKGPGDVTPPVGVANAYDAMHLLGARDREGRQRPRAMRSATAATRSTSTTGLIKTYRQAVQRAEPRRARPDDYIWAQFIDNQIVPVRE